MTKPSTNHHYLPCFYSKRWGDASRGRKARVWGADVSKDGVVTPWKCQRKVEKIAADEDLYAHRNIGGDVSRHTEEAFFNRHDGPASQALHVLVTEGPEMLTKKDRLAWSSFMVGLDNRHPDRLDEIRHQLRAIRPGVVDHLRSLPGDDRSKQNVEDFLASGLLEQQESWGVLNLMAKGIKDEPSTRFLNGLKWTVIQDPDASLVTTDKPLVSHWSDGGDLVALAIALTPAKLQVLTNPEGTIDGDDEAMFVKDHLDALFRNRPGIVISSTRVSQAAATVPAGERDGLTT